MPTLDLNETITVQMFLDPDVNEDLSVVYASVVDRRACRARSEHGSDPTFDASEYVVKILTPEVSFDSQGVLLVDDFMDPTPPRISVQLGMPQSMVSLPGWIGLGVTVLRDMSENTVPSARDFGRCLMEGLCLPTLLGREHEALMRVSNKHSGITASQLVAIRDTYLRVAIAWRSALSKEGRIQFKVARDLASSRLKEITERASPCAVSPINLSF